MASDRNLMEDSVTVELTSPGENLPPVGDRPADGAPTAAWVDYCVDLGADRTYLTQTTLHFDHLEADGATATYLEEPKFTKSQLIDLADRLR